ncbi:MAG: hypothetical protein QXM27_02995 [Candidatus Pacearchaeota archaeon]
MANLKSLKKFKNGYDERRNYSGRPKGSRNFRTLFIEAIEKIATQKNLKGLDLEVELVEKGITEALKRNYSFWKDIMDRLYGKPTESMRMETEKKPFPYDLKINVLPPRKIDNLPEPKPPSNEK